MKSGRPFYSMSEIGDYTYAPWKVVWPNMGNKIDAAVISKQDGKPIVPQHIVTLIPFTEKDEAYYVASVINSSPFQFAVHSYSQAGGKSFGTPRILEHIKIPVYEPKNPLHRTLSSLSLQAHELAILAYFGDAAAQDLLHSIETKIDQTSMQLWELSEIELTDIQTSLLELKGEDLVNSDDKGDLDEDG